MIITHPVLDAQEAPEMKNTDHGPTGQASQKTQVSRPPGFRHEDNAQLWTKADWEATAARAKTILNTKAAVRTDLIVTGRGDMEPHWKLPLEKAQQDKDRYRPHIGTFDELQSFIDQNLGVGRKEIAPYWVAGVSVTRYCNDEDSFVGAQVLAHDLDGLLETDADWEFFYACLEELCGPGIAVNGSSTANHMKPGKGARSRAAILLGFTIWRYEDYKLLAEHVAEFLRAKFGAKARGNAVDACATKAMQCMYCPKVPEQSDLKNYVRKTFGHRSWGQNGEDLLKALRAEEDVRQAAKEAENKEAEKKEAERKAAEQKAFAEGKITKSQMSRSRQGVEAARADLDALPIHAGCGRRNQLIPKAISKCRNRGLDQQQTADLIEQVYGVWHDDPTWVERYANCIFKKPHTPWAGVSRPRRLGVNQSLASMIDSFARNGSFDLDGAVPPDTEQKQGVTSNALNYSNITCSLPLPKTPETPTGSNPNVEVGQVGDTHDTRDNSSHADVTGEGPDGAPPTPVTTPQTQTWEQKREAAMWAMWAPLGLPMPTKFILCGGQWLPALSGEGSSTRRDFLVVIDSGVATGKTTVMEASAREVLGRGGRVLRILPGTVLAEGQAEQLDISSHRDPKTMWDRDSISTTLHSLNKVQIYRKEEMGYLGAIDLDAELETKIIATPIDLLQLDESNEDLAALTSAPMRGLGRCDLVQNKMEEIVRDMAYRWLRGEEVQIQVACAHTKVEVIRWIVHCLGWDESKEPIQPWTYIYNPWIALNPGIRVCQKIRFLRARLQTAALQGHKVFMACGTKRSVKVESRRFALAFFRSKAGFDPLPFLEPYGKNILSPASKMGPLVKELERRGLRLEDVRARILTGASDDFSPAVERFVKNPNGEAEHYDAIFLTPIAASGINLDKVPFRVFACYREGPGMPGASTLLQAIFRCRIQTGPINALIDGQFESKSDSITDWFEHYTSISTTWKRDVGGLCDFQIVTGKDGVVHALPKDERDEYLLWRLAEARSIEEREAHIADRLDSNGVLYQKGDFTLLAEQWGLDVTSEGEQEHDFEDRTPEEIKADNKADSDLVGSLRVDTTQALVESVPLSLEEARKMRKRGVRSTDIRLQCEKIVLMHRYGLEELTVDNVEEHHKYGKNWNVAAIWRAIRKDPGANPGDAKAVARHFHEKSRGVSLHQDRDILKAIYFEKWCQELFPNGLDQVVANQESLPSFGDYLASPGHEEDRRIFGLVFGFSVEDEDLPKATANLFRSIGAHVAPKQRRAGKGKRVWSKVLDQGVWSLLMARTEPEVFRLLQPEKAKEEWAEKEKRILAYKVPQRVQFSIEEFLREEVITAVIPGTNEGIRAA